MENDEDRAQQLIRILGRERDSNTPELVTAAEKEIIRRLGGTRKQARRRVTIRGVFTTTLGLLALAGSVAVATTEAQEVGDYIGLLLAACLGVALVALGMANLTWNKWAVRRPRFRGIVGATNIAALMAEPPLEDLLEIVGQGRADHPRQEVAGAERELADRLGRGRDQTAKRVRTWGLVAIGFGLYMGFLGTVGIVSVLRASLDKGATARFPLAAIWWTMIVTASFGWVLFAGGLGLRKRKDWGRRTVFWAIWIYFTCALAVIPFKIAWTFLEGVGPADIAAALGASALNIAVWSAILWSVTKPLRYPEIREACGGPLGAVEARGGPTSRRLARRMLVAAIALVVLAPVGVYGVWWFTSARALNREIQALRRSGAVIDLAKWKPPLPPAEENGAELLRHAFAELQRGEDRIANAGWPAPEMPEGKPFEGWRDLLSLDTWTPDQAAYAAKVLADLGGALELAREAVSRPHVNFDWDYSDPAALCSPELSDLSLVARLASLSAALHVHRGDCAAALADGRLALRLARFPDGDHSLIVHLVRMGLATRAAATCERALQAEDIPADQLAGLDELLQGARRGLELERASAWERADLIGWWYEEIQAGRWGLFGRQRASTLKAFVLRPLLRSRMTIAIRLANEGVRLSAKPPWVAMPELEKLQRRIEHDGEGMTHLLGADTAALLLPAYAAAAQAYARCNAHLDALRIAIALRRYRADAGGTAQALADLVPAYLPELPPDPFTGEDFLTKRADGMLTVYSVGENLEDDGGDLKKDKWGHAPDVGVRIAE